MTFRALIKHLNVDIHFEASSPGELIEMLEQLGRFRSSLEDSVVRAAPSVVSRKRYKILFKNGELTLIYRG